MKSIVLMIWVVIISSCRTYNSTSNYILVRVDSSDISNSYPTSYYVDSNNNKRKMTLYFWDNGKIMTKAFFYNNFKDGDWEFYSITGQLKSILKFKKNVLIEQIEYNNNGEVIKND